MTEDQTAKPLQATFNVDDEDFDTTEGIGFEPGVRYQFSLEKPPTGKYMQYSAKNGGLFVLSKKCPTELSTAYQKHPDQFEIFTVGEVNGQQALVPGRDFEKFAPYLTKVVDIAWVYTSDSGQKRLVFMSLNAGNQAISKDPVSHPEWDSPAVALARKLGVSPPDPKSKEKFNFSFLHPGITITSEVLMVKQKNQDRERAILDVDTIELVSTDGTPAGQTKLESSDIDPEIRMTISELAEGCKTVVEVIKKAKEHLKKSGESTPENLRLYSEAIDKMKSRKEILG